MIARVDDFEINPIHDGDAWKICDFCITNSDRLKRFLPKTLAQNLNPTLSKIFVEKKVNNFKTKTEFLFTLKHSETRKLVGLMYLKELDWTIKQGEFAYAIDYTVKGNGIMSQAIANLSQYAFNHFGLKTIQIITHKDNASSVQVATSNNFIWKKTLEKAFTPNGEDALNMELYELYN